MKKLSNSAEAAMMLARRRIAIHLAKNRQLTSAIKPSENSREKLEIINKPGIIIFS